MIFGFLPQNVKTKAVAVAFSIAWLEAGVEPRPGGAGARDRLAAFRGELYRCFTARADALFEVTEAVLCAGGPVKTLAGLSLAPEHRRGHGALYDAVNHGGSASPGCAVYWLGCRCRGALMGGWCWRWM
jgi:hypothetical protein